MSDDVKEFFVILLSGVVAAVLMHEWDAITESNARFDHYMCTATMQAKLFSYACSGAPFHGGDLSARSLDHE